MEAASSVDNPTLQTIGLRLDAVGRQLADAIQSVEEPPISFRANAIRSAARHIERAKGLLNRVAARSREPTGEGSGAERRRQTDCGKESFDSATELRVVVPTYHGKRHAELVEKGAIAEYGPPYAPVAIREVAGLRVVLGTHNITDIRQPDILIERQPRGWMFFLHARGGGDPSGYVYFLDDGSSFVAPEFGDDAIRVLERGEAVPEFDEVGE